MTLTDETLVEDTKNLVGLYDQLASLYTKMYIKENHFTLENYIKKQFHAIDQV